VASNKGGEGRSKQKYGRIREDVSSVESSRSKWEVGAAGRAGYKGLAFRGGGRQIKKEGNGKRALSPCPRILKSVNAGYRTRQSLQRSGVPGNEGEGFV